MCNNIKTKALGVRKTSFLLVFLLIISMFTMVACDSNKEVTTTQEFEIISCYLEHRNVTNNFGGVLRVEEYFHYAYLDDNGKVIFKEMLFGDYIDFQVTEGKPKVIITTSKSKTTYAFRLTKEMYNYLNSGQ